MIELRIKVTVNNISVMLGHLSALREREEEEEEEEGEEGGGEEKEWGILTGPDLHPNSFQVEQISSVNKPNMTGPSL